MKHVLRIAILGLASTSLLNCTDTVDDQGSADDEAEVDRDDDQPLTPASTDAPEKIVRDYLQGHAGATGAQLQIIGQAQSRGVTHVRMEQVVDGLRVYGTQVKAALSARGELLQVIHKLGPSTRPLAAQAVESDALRTALVEYGYGVEPAKLRTLKNTTTFARTAEMYREPSVERVAYVDGKTLRVGFLVETWSQIGNQLDYTLIGGDGRIVTAERRTNNDQYRVFTEDPSKGGQVTVDGTGKGWLGSGAQTSHAITGANVKAYLDTDNNNAADSAATTGATPVTTGNFLTAAALAEQPSTSPNRDVAIQNLFYFNNVMHDSLKSKGFDAANANFEGNDPVLAEGQDGGGLDNANFSTPSDGTSPRMQMYLWSGTTPAGVFAVGSTNYGVYPSSFGPAFTAGGVSGTTVLATPANGCTTISGVSGKIAVIDRGTCDFVVKVKNAQTAGATAVIIVNNVDGTAFGPGGTDQTITIRSGMANLGDRAALIGATGTLKTNPTTPLRLDGDLDADIVFHEYGHGLTWRMIGGMSGVLAGAIGEGASDVNAFLHNCSGTAPSATCDDIIGEYAYGDYTLGIRSKQYSQYTETYANWTAGEVHKDGEIYAAAMWKVLENYQAAGFTADDLLGDFVDGMNFTPSTPRPEQMRDGMISGLSGLKDPSNPRFCPIWRGFAKRGIGVGATAKVKGPRVTINQSFAVPAGCAAP